MIRQGSPVRVKDDGNEIRRHGTPGYPVAVYRNHYNSAGDTFAAWHWHRELEIIRVKEGTARVMLPGASLNVTAGETLFINSEVMHAARRAGEAACLFHSVVFSPDFIGNGPEGVLFQKYLTPLLSDEGHPYVYFALGENACEAAAERMDEILRAEEKEQTGYEFRVREALTGLCLAAFFDHRDNASMEASSHPSQAVNDRVKKMVRFIHENYSENITTKEIAAAANISESECLRSFKNALFVTPNRYLRRCRLGEAAKALRETDKSVSEAALDAGFSHMSYFAACFKEEYGLLPGEYRRQGRAGALSEKIHDNT